MKKVLLTALILVNAFCLSAQRYHIKKEKSQLYILHKVAPKESLFSLGRLFGISHKDIATANKLGANEGLKVGQQLRIPLNKTNFLQTAKKNGYEPVYHTIAKGDNLYKLSRQYNNVKEDQLKKWNKLSKNVVKPGQEIIVGYVKVNIVKADETDAPVATVPAQTNDTIKSSVAVSETGDAKPPAPGNHSQEGNQTEEIYVFTGGNENAEGVFAAQFAVSNASAQPKTITGMAATFKSTSGWNDRKYYILINDIAAGTIVKVNANNKTIYAKVLESLPALKDNKQLLCRLSNAAASALGIADQKFNVELFYSE